MHPIHGYQLLNGERRHKSRIMHRSLATYFPPFRFLWRVFG